jgi:hypothetical protein
LRRVREWNGDTGVAHKFRLVGERRLLAQRRRSTGRQRLPNAAVSGCSGGWMPPPKYCNKETSDQRKYLKAHYDPVPDRRGVSMSNPNRRVHKRLQNPVDGIRTVGRDFPLGQAIPQFAVAIDAQIDRDDASDDFIKEKLH